MRFYNIKTKNNISFKVHGTITDNNEFDFGFIQDLHGNDVSDMVEAFGLYEKIANLVIEQNTPKQ